MLLNLITALAVAAGPAPATTPPDLTGIDKLVDEHVTTVMADEKIPGVTVTVIANGRQLVHRGYGWADVQRRIPVDPDRSRFLIGSETKLFTAQAALQLVDQDRLDLDADVNSYLTTFKIRDTFPGRPVTLRHLLTHTAGFDEDFVVGSGADVRPLGTALAATQPVRLRPPGAGVSYNNYGVALAGHLVEIASGMPFEEYTARHVFAPLGMADSRIACGGLGDTKAYLVDGSATDMACANFTASGAGPVSTASDMARYLRAQLELDPRLGAGIAAEMQRQQHTEHPGLPGMGYMWEERPHHGQRMLFKGGDMPGMHSYMFLLPQARIGIHVMANGDGTGRHGLDGFALAEKILDRYLPVAPPPRVTPPAGVSADGYEGWYRSSRTSHGSVLKVQALTDDPVHVVALAGGGIRTTGLKGGQRTWTPIEPGLFQMDGGWDRIAFPEPGQLAVSRATVVYDRIGPLEHPALHRALLLAAVLATLAGLAGIPLAAVVRRIRRRPRPSGPRLPRLLGWTTSVLVLVFTAGFGALLADQARALPLVLDGAPVLIALLVVASLTVPFAAALLGLAVAAWCKRWGRLPGRIAHSLLAAGFCAFAGIAVTYNLVGPSFT